MPDLSFSIYATWLVVLVAIIIIIFVAERHKSMVAMVALLTNSIVTSIPAVAALRTESIDIQLYAGHFMGTLPLRIDGLSAWFMIIVNITSLMGALYGMGYMKQYSVQTRNISLHWSLFIIFHLSMVWVCMVQNSLAFLVVWEIMSVSSMLLVIFEHDKAETVKAGLNYLIQMHVGVMLLTVAFLWVYTDQNTFDFDGLKAFFAHTPSLLLFLLFFAGFGIKAGFIPFHTWLPHAHPAAPSHVSGVMSGVIVKMGIYGILRMATLIDVSMLQLCGEIIISLSVFTALYGIFNAAIHRDIKKMLAFCTIENIGIIGIAIGLGMIGQSQNNNWMMLAGYGGALLHSLNHSLFKSLLFFVAGNIYSATHTRNMEHLGGLIKKMPITAGAFLLGALAIGGLPPFNGFISEFIIYSGLLAGIRSQAPEISTLMIVAIAGMAMVGGLSLISFSKTFGVVFLGTPRKTLPNTPKESSRIMLAPIVLLTIPIIGIGLFPATIFYPLMRAIGTFSTTNTMITLGNEWLPLLTKTGYLSGFFILLLLLTLLVRKIVTRQAISSVSPTWGCGYNAPAPTMQYTGKSFSKNLAKLFSFIAIEDKSYRELSPANVFPRHRTFKSRYLEFFESRLIDGGINVILRFFNQFLFIHNGQIQWYILYGIIFMVMMITATMLNLI